MCPWSAWKRLPLRRTVQPDARDGATDAHNGGTDAQEGATNVGNGAIDVQVNATDARNDMPMREKAIPAPSGSICELANAAQVHQIASRTAGPSAKRLGTRGAAELQASVPLQRGWVHGAAEDHGRCTRLPAGPQAPLQRA